MRTVLHSSIVSMRWTFSDGFFSVTVITCRTQTMGTSADIRSVDTELLRIDTSWALEELRGDEKPLQSFCCRCRWYLSKVSGFLYVLYCCLAAIVQRLDQVGLQWMKYLGRFVAASRGLQSWAVVLDVLEPASHGWDSANLGHLAQPSAQRPVPLGYDWQILYYPVWSSTPQWGEFQVSISHHNIDIQSMAPSILQSPRLSVTYLGMNLNWASGLLWRPIISSRPPRLY